MNAFNACPNYESQVTNEIQSLKVFFSEQDMTLYEKRTQHI